MAKTKRQAPVPLERFHKHYSSTAQWGDRWHSSLFPALLRATRYTALRNRHAVKEDFDRSMIDVNNLQRIELLSSADEDKLHCYISNTVQEDGLSSTRPFPEPTKSANGLNTHWNLDLASLLAVNVLDAGCNDKVVDMCAAPGGKSVALAQTIFEEPSSSTKVISPSCLHSNELSLERMKRLDANLRQYVPTQYRETKKLLCLHQDGTLPTLVFPLGLGGYDKVLLDAPCSSERHIVHAQDRASRQSSTKTAEELTRWSPTLAKRLAETQVKLLQNALRSVRVGGRVLYATCSISKEENDDVVEAAMRWSTIQHQKNAISWICQSEVLSEELQAKLEAWAERTESGWIVLPDHDTPQGSGWGPLYFSLLTKVKGDAP